MEIQLLHDFCRDTISAAMRIQRVHAQVQQASAFSEMGWS
jgi:hypothetical protein